MIKQLLLLILLPMVCSQALASGKLVEFFASYNAEIKGFSVKAQRTLGKESDSNYQLTFTANSLLATVNEQSVFTYKNGKIVSNAYTYQQKALGKTKQRSLQFNSQDGTIVSHYKEQQKTLKDVNNAFDALNYQLALQLDVAQGKTEGSYTVANKDELKQYQFQVVGQESIETEIGTLKTTKVEIRRANKDKVTYIWLANNWHYLLVNLEQYVGDKKNLSIHLNKANINGTTVSPK